MTEYEIEYVKAILRIAGGLESISDSLDKVAEAIDRKTDSDDISGLAKGLGAIKEAIRDYNL